VGVAEAAAYLEKESWLVLERNFRGRRGEIDLIARRGEILAFVEVKNWSSFGLSELEVALGPEKRKRIVETSKIFLNRHREYSSLRIRYDLILMRKGRVERHIESAFTGEL
jgi:putative endonuclease